MPKVSPKTGRASKANVAGVSKSQAKRVAAQSKEGFSHIDRSNGKLLKRSQLNQEKPWLSPISNQATVEELTQDELENLKPEDK